MKYSVKFNPRVESIVAGETSVTNAETVLLKIQQVLPLIVRCIRTNCVLPEHDFPASKSILKLMERRGWQTIPGKLTRIQFFLSTWGSELSPGYDLEVRALKSQSKTRLFFQIFYAGGGYQGLWIHGFDDGTNF